jgi:hypothetical protein
MSVAEGQAVELLAEADALQRKAEAWGDASVWPATTWMRQANELRQLAAQLTTNAQIRTKG